MADSVGRPMKFESVQALEQKIEAYFNHCLPHPEEYTDYEYQKKIEILNRGAKTEREIEVDDHSVQPKAIIKWRISEPITPTVSGLAIALDTSRQTLINYEEKGQYFDTIKKAKDLIEFHWEEMLKGNNVTGVIFNLKNNYGWRDRTETDLTSAGEKLASPYASLTDEQLKKLADR